MKYYSMNNDYDEAVIQTILQSSVNVLLIGMYTTVVRTCLQVADCTAEDTDGNRWLIIDPTYECSDALGYQLIGASVFFLWGCLPFLALGWNLIKYRRQGRGVLEEHMAESAEFNVTYGWAVKKYKTKSYFAFLWEIQNALVKVLMVVGSELMYGPVADELTSNRTILHMGTISASLLMHILVRPYNDSMANVVVILFSSTSLVGVFASSDPLMQKIFVGLTFSSIVLVVFLLALALRSTLKEKKNKVGQTDKDKKRKHEFSLFETRLLFPFLIFVWALHYFMVGVHKLFALCVKKKKGSKKKNSENQVVDEKKEEKMDEKMEEKKNQSSVKDVDKLDKRKQSTITKRRVYYNSKSAGRCYGTTTGITAIHKGKLDIVVCMEKDSALYAGQNISFHASKLYDAVTEEVMEKTRPSPPLFDIENGIQPPPPTISEWGEEEQNEKGSLLKTKKKKKKKKKRRNSKTRNNTKVVPVQNQEEKNHPPIPAPPVPSVTPSIIAPTEKKKSKFGSFFSSTKSVTMFKKTKKEKDGKDGNNGNDVKKEMKIKSEEIQDKTPVSNFSISVVHGPNEGQTTNRLLRESFQMYIGKDDEECDFVLKDDTISDQHAVICWDQEQSVLMFIDHESDSGSKVNGKVAEANVPVVLTHDDEINIGESMLVVMIKEPPKLRPKPPAPVF